MAAIQLSKKNLSAKVFCSGMIHAASSTNFICGAGMFQLRSIAYALPILFSSSLIPFFPFFFIGFRMLQGFVNG